MAAAAEQTNIANVVQEDEMQTTTVQNSAQTSLQTPESKDLSNQELIIFKAITGFVSALNDEFGRKHKNIALYNRLLEKTGVMHVRPIKKHIDIFRQFFDKNRKAMETSNAALLVDPRIEYSHTVFLDVAVVMKQSVPDDLKVIWRHLLTIQYHIDPMSAAGRMLRASSAASSSDSDGKEQDFLQNIMNKVQESAEKANITENSNPTEIMSSMMQSGAMTDLMNGMYKGINDGSIDISKIFGSLQGMMGSMGGGGMGGGLPAAGGSPPQMPDLGAIMGMVGPMMNQIMGGMGGGMPPRGPPPPPSAEQ